MHTSAADAAAAFSLQRVDVLPTDGSQAQCFYHALGTALGVASEADPLQPQRRRWPAIDRLLREALSLLHDAALLQRYGLPINSDADAAAVRLAKERYLDSVDFRQQQWGGSLEMLLLSHQSRGALAFDTYNSTSSMHWSRFRAAAAILLDAAGQPLPPLPLTRIVVLHACAYNGGDTINHFELLQFRVDGQLRHVWQHDELESPAQRDQRTLLVAAACDEARRRTRQAAHTVARRHDALAAAAAQRNGERERPEIPWWRKMEQGLPVLHPALRTQAAAAKLKSAALSGRGKATGVEVRVHEALSRAAYGKPLQLGLFAASAFKSGELLTPYGGTLRHLTDYQGKRADDPLAIKSHSRRVPQSDDLLDGLPLACMYRRPLATAASVQRAVDAGIAALEPTSEHFSPADLHLFRSSAFGFMANTSRPQLCNATMVYLPHRLGGRGDVVLQVPWLAAIKDIAPHDEILCGYNSHQSKQLLRCSAPLHSRSAIPSAPRRRTSSDGLEQLPAHMIDLVQRLSCDDPAEDTQLHSSTHSSPRMRNPRAVSSSDIASPSCFTPQRKPAAAAEADVHSPSCFTPQQPSETGPTDAPSPSCFTPPASSAPTGALAAAIRTTPHPRARKSLHTGLDASAQPAHSLQLLPFPRSATLATIAEEESDSESSEQAATPSALPSTARAGGISLQPRQLKLPPSRAIVIRTVAQRLKLADWETHFARLSEAQAREIAKLYATKAGWWKGAASSLAKPAAPAAASSAAPLTPRAGPPVAAAASLAAAEVAPRTCKRTSNRWYHPDEVAQDWAEYRSCCGSLDVVAQHLASSATAKLHSSASVINFFSVRLSYRALFQDRAAFATHVQSQLAFSRKSERSVLWDGVLVCASCFRAALGLGRATIYAHRHMQLLPSCEGEVEGAGLPLTPFGSLRKSRERARTARVETLLLQYASTMGQTAPNPKGKNHDHQHIYLPHSRIPELAAALNRMEHAGHGAGGGEVKDSTLRRVIVQLAKTNYRVSLKPSNSMCRCEHCDLLDGQMEECRSGPSRDKRLYKLKQAMKEAHLRQVKEQRDHFDEQKRTAEQQPCKLWCLTFDGMDQNKTQLPHLKGRLAKNLDNLPRLGVHAVGAFCFGAPLPVLGFLNTPDVRKDGSLSVAIVDHALDLQFERLEQLHATVHCRTAREGSSTDDTAAAAHAGRRVYRSGPGLHWPERLHVTFDNAAGDAKNQWMFRYLGLLVLHGVFDTITISTLIVGHTHDIVDQMFSVWAKLLCITDCKTYEQMRKLFHEKYHSRVRLLVKLMTGAELTEEEAKDAGLANAEQRQELAEDLAAEQAANFDQWNGAALRYAEQLEADLQRDAAAVASSSPAAAVSSAGELGARSSHRAFHTPHVVRQTHSFNMCSFFESMTLPSGKSVVRERPMTGQCTPHVFGIETDAEDGCVYLYNKHLAKSTDKSQRGERHLFLNCKTGDYTSRCLLFRASDVAYTLQEPPVNPPVAAVEVDQLRETIATYARQGKLTPGELDEWKRELDAFAAAQQRLIDSCAECALLTQKLKDIGVVSHRKDLSEEDKLKQREKGRERKQTQTQLDEHLRDVAHYGEQVQGPPFLGKWLQRVKQHIQPGYIERGVQNPLEYRTADYHVHPFALCTDGRPAAENPHNALFETDCRMDADYLVKHGPPQASYFALARCADAREPFGFGRIHHVFTPGEVQPAFVRDLKQAAAGLTQEQWTACLKQLEAPAASAAAPSEQAEGEMDLGDASADLLQQQLDKHAKGRRKVDMRAIPNVVMEWYNYRESDVEKLHLLDDAWWDAQDKSHAAEEAAAAAVSVPLETTPPARAWVVDMYKHIHFQQQQPRHRRFVLVQGSELVAWHGNKKHFLKTTDQLKADVFKKLRLDLTEQVAAPARASRKQGSAAAAAAAQSIPAAAQREEADVVPMESESDPEFVPSAEEMPSPAAPSAAPSLAQRSTPRPKTRAKQPSYTEGEDDSEAAAEERPTKQPQGVHAATAAHSRPVTPSSRAAGCKRSANNTSRPRKKKQQRSTSRSRGRSSSEEEEEEEEEETTSSSSDVRLDEQAQEADEPMEEAPATPQRLRRKTTRQLLRTEEEADPRRNKRQRREQSAAGRERVQQQKGQTQQQQQQQQQQSSSRIVMAEQLFA